MGQKRKKKTQIKSPLNHSLSYKRGSERSERAQRSAQAKRVSGASKRANGRASGPVLQSVLLVILAQSAPPPRHMTHCHHQSTFITLIYTDSIVTIFLYFHHRRSILILYLLLSSFHPWRNSLCDSTEDPDHIANTINIVIMCHRYHFKPRHTYFRPTP